MNLYWRWFWARKLGLPLPREFDLPPDTFTVKAGARAVILPGQNTGLALAYQGRDDQVIDVYPTGVVTITDSNGGRWIIKAVNS